jgi:hypothetical protein
MLGTANYRLSRDIVIVKYFARPLAKLSFKELSSQQHQKEYLKIWGELYLDNSLQIYFLKRNVLPALFFFSANLEFANLIQIMQNLPIIEASFRQFYSSEQYEKDIDSLKIHLYHENFNVSLQARHKKNSLGIISPRSCAPIFGLWHNCSARAQDCISAHILRSYCPEKKIR